ncbi:MAG: hypothetical protein AWU54_2250 [Candidatus Frackibacter sp. T328-2]|nr:MAG: hypothetical protein AWU54_2250 [Candidatus Frackibacter sp. T328-2]
MSKKKPETINDLLEYRDANLDCLTESILNKYNFEYENITEFADKYSDAYVQVYNFLAKKYQKENYSVEDTYGTDY